MIKKDKLFLYRFRQFLGLVCELHLPDGDIKQKASDKKNLLHKKWSFVLRISSINLTKYTRKCGFYDIY